MKAKQGRCLLLIVCLSFIAFGLSQNRPALVDEMGYADLILVNGKIVSMDDRSTTPDTPGHIYEAMAVKGKRIMALGGTDEMKKLAGPKTQIVDVDKKTVLPGLVQTHYHLFGTAATKYGPQVGLVDPSVKLIVAGEQTVEATAKKIRAMNFSAARLSTSTWDRRLKRI